MLIYSRGMYPPSDINEDDLDDDGSDRLLQLSVAWWSWFEIELLFFRRIWTTEEDEAIRLMVHKYGTKSWALIAENLSKEHSIAGRSGKQCRERWHNHLGELLYLVLRLHVLY